MQAVQNHEGVQKRLTGNYGEAGASHPDLKLLQEYAITPVTVLLTAQLLVGCQHIVHGCAQRIDLVQQYVDGLTYNQLSTQCTCALDPEDELIL